MHFIYFFESFSKAFFFTSKISSYVAQISFFEKLIFTLEISKKKASQKPFVLPGWEETFDANLIQQPRQK